MRLYKVDFTFNDSYSPKEGFTSIVLVVSAYDQFTALKEAWDKITVLDLPEPKSFSASKVGN